MACNGRMSLPLTRQAANLIAVTADSNTSGGHSRMVLGSSRVMPALSNDYNWYQNMAYLELQLLVIHGQHDQTRWPSLAVCAVQATPLFVRQRASRRWNISSLLLVWGSQKREEIKDTKDTLKLQKDIDQLGCWARKWGMRFQPVKCNMMQITRQRIKKIHASYILEGTILENVESIKVKR